MAGFPVGPAQHMAKIIECASVAGAHGTTDGFGASA